MNKKKQLSFFALPFNKASGFFMMVLTLPKFFAKEITFGTLMILQGAFFKVKTSLAFFINSYTEIALWRSVLVRLTGFVEVVESTKSLQKQEPKKLPAEPNSSIHLHNVSLFLPNQQRLFHPLNTTIAKGSRILVSGPSGCGKSTLFRAISGIWPFIEGSIRLPLGETSFFLPQKPYLPLGTLREALLYPSRDVDCPNETLISLLSLCELSHLQTKLNDFENWSQILSPGEQQRVAFVRAFFHKPDWLFLDEATSALDEKTQSQLYHLISTRLPNTTIISIGHRSSLESFHSIKLDLKECPKYH